MLFERASTTLKAATVYLHCHFFFTSIYYAQTEHLPINWTEASIIGFGIESHYEDPAVKPLASCPCDYTASHCDITCCCDEDCSSSQLGAFLCLSGLTGGQRTDKNIDNNCKYQGPYSPQWHDILCFTNENNPYLGLFFRNEPSIQNYQKYIDKTLRPKFSYEDKETHMKEEKFMQHYALGSDIKIDIDSKDVKSTYFLSIPHPVLNGVCIDRPVKFLEEINHDCLVMLTPETCTTEKILNSNYYLSQPNPLSQIVGNLSDHQLINTSVSYECLKDVSKFVKAEGLHLFPDFLVKSEISPASECNNQRIPYFNKTSQVCENVVLNVEYNMKWKADSIKEVQANIKIGTVPVSLTEVHPKYLREGTTVKKNKYLQREGKGYKREGLSFPIISKTLGLYLVQHFEVHFHHMGTMNSSIAMQNSVLLLSENNTVQDTLELLSSYNITERSGNPGYQRGRPLLTGYLVHNNTEEVNSSLDPLLFVDIGNGAGLFILSPGGECSEEKTERVVFGVNMVSSCHYSLKKTISCCELRNQINAMFSILVKGDVISKLGWPNVTLEKEFLPILWSTDKMHNSKSDRCIIPKYLHYEVAYQDIVDSVDNQLQVHQITGCYLRVQHEDCDVTSGSVYLTTSVKFLKSEKPSKLSRFWKTMDDRWCSGGTCWHEILHPWKNGEGRMTAGTMYSAFLIDLTINTAVMFAFVLPLVILIVQHRYKVRL